jgi:hypothetical protein
MTAATFDRDTIYVGGPEKVLNPLVVATAVTIYNGTLVAKDKTGKGRPAADAAGYVVYGIASHQAVQADGDDITVVRGYAKLDNSGTDPLAAADIGHWCYVEDDSTVRKKPGTYGRRAGIFLGLDADDDQAIVYVGNPQPQSDAYNATEITASGAIDPDIGHQEMSTDGTKAYTLAAGSFPGQEVTLTWIAATNTPHGVVTPAAVVGYATVEGNTLGDTCTFRWTGSAWALKANGGCTVA